MSKPTILIGILLIILGAACYFLTGQASLTALIPAGPGILLLIFGLLGQAESRRKHMMHGAAVVSLLGTLAGFGKGLTSLPSAAGIGATLMGVFCLVHLVMCIRSFRAARQARDAAST